LIVFLAIIIGFLSAVLAGMFGIGGAALTTPSLRLFLGASPAIALGTTLPVTIPTAASAAATYWRRGLVDARVAGLCCATGVLGATGGALATRYLNLHYLMFATGAMVLYVSVMTIRRGISQTPEPADIDVTPPADQVAGAHGEAEPEVCTSPAQDAPAQTLLASADSECRPPALYALIIGLAAGIMSGLLGVGGGVLLIPGFLYILRMPLRRSFATSLAVICVIAIPGTIVHSFLHHISWSLVLYLVIGSIPGAWLGARLNLRTGERVLYIMFGTLLGAFGVLFIVNEIISMTH
jgi:uncharacterized membrane protein YfcA